MTARKIDIGTDYRIRAVPDVLIYSDSIRSPVGLYRAGDGGVRLEDIRMLTNYPYDLAP